MKIEPHEVTTYTLEATAEEFAVLSEYLYRTVGGKSHARTVLDEFTDALERFRSGEYRLELVPRAADAEDPAILVGDA